MVGTAVGQAHNRVRQYWANGGPDCPAELLAPAAVAQQIKILNESCSFSQGDPLLAPAPPSDFRADRVYAAFEFLHEFVYRRCGVPYVLTRGSLLAAARHFGHNPTDTDGDADILIPYVMASSQPDCKRDYEYWWRWVRDALLSTQDETGVGLGDRAMVNKDIEFEASATSWLRLLLVITNFLRLVLVSLLWLSVLVLLVLLGRRSPLFLLFMAAIGLTFVTLFARYTWSRHIYLDKPMEIDVAMLLVTLPPEQCTITLCHCKFGPIDALCPLETLNLLEAEFGSTWRTPMPGADSTGILTGDLHGSEIYCDAPISPDGEAENSSGHHHKHHHHHHKHHHEND